MVTKVKLSNVKRIQIFIATFIVSPGLLFSEKEVEYIYNVGPNSRGILFLKLKALHFKKNKKHLSI